MRIITSEMLITKEIKIPQITKVYDPLSTEKKSSEMIVEPPDRRREKEHARISKKDWDTTYYVVRLHFSETRKVQRQIFPDNFPAQA